MFRCLPIINLVAFCILCQGSDTLTLKVDHVSVCGSDLAKLQRAFATVGLESDYGGPHANSFTQMSLLGFDDGSYIELIAPKQAGATAPESGEWANLINANAGPCAWAISPRDLTAELKRLQGLGMTTGTLTYGNRKKPDGTLLEWETAAIGNGQPGATLPFMIKDRTPRDLRVRPSASVSGTELTGIRFVVLGVKNLDQSIGLFRKAYGWAAPAIQTQAEFGTKLAYFAGTPVILAAPLGQNSWLTDRLAQVGETPVAYVLGTRDADRSFKRFQLKPSAEWFGCRIAWFDPLKLGGIRLAIGGEGHK